MAAARLASPVDDFEIIAGETGSKEWDDIGAQWNLLSESHPLHVSVKATCSGKGLPNNAVRRLIWPLITGSADFSVKNKEVYGELVKLSSSAESEATKKMWSKIERDLDRTYPKEPLFNTPNRSGQESLGRILKAYALFNPTIGYCQGMNFIAAFLLLVGFDENEAFWLFSVVMKEHLGSLFCAGVPGIMRALHLVDELIAEFVPEVYSHFKETNVVAAMWASAWLHTVFCYENIPLEFTARVWDAFLVRGWEVPLRTALALISLHRRELVTLVDFDQLTLLRSMDWDRHAPAAVVGAGLRVAVRAETLARIACISDDIDESSPLIEQVIALDAEADVIAGDS